MNRELLIIELNKVDLFRYPCQSLLRVLPDTVLRVALEYIFCCCEEHDGDYVTNKNWSVKPI
ncbi:hypothetical protein [Bacteroides acidifaciens]|uniref:hypothetical protein n=1 Tax=Bacteroides acidifaciens TaxID=85831 RepID=UPI003F68C2E2